MYRGTGGTGQTIVCCFFHSTILHMYETNTVNWDVDLFLWSCSTTKINHLIVYCISFV